MPLSATPILTDTAAALERAGVLYSVRLSRAALASLPSATPRRIARLHVIRNHAVEHALSALHALFSPLRLGVETTFSDYDDTLSLGDLPAHDAVLVWLDFSRFKIALDSAEFSTWFQGRLGELRRQTEATVVVVGPVSMAPAWGEALRVQPGIEWLSTEAAVAAVGVERVHDLRAAQFSGTPFSSGFLLQIARELSAGPLARALGVGIKAIVCDLDGTLYEGVLGEDGVEGIALPLARRRVQERLAALARRGVMLAVLSRNTPEDVAQLFATRRDFPLAGGDFAVIEASWEPKHRGFARIVEQLRIGADSVLFLDDNPGELLDIGHEFPQARLLPAHDATTLESGLRYFPGIEGFDASAPGRGIERGADLRANAARAALAAERSDEDYLRELGVFVEFRLDDPTTCARMAELSGKTNQFNPALARLSPARVAALQRDPAGFVLAVALRDRLSDSGIVAAWCGRIEGCRLVTEDLAVSCRSLGRRLEDILLAAAFRVVAARHGATEIELPWREGPRNQPALRWLERVSGGPLDSSPLVLPVPALPAAVRHVTFNLPLS